MKTVLLSFSNYLSSGNSSIFNLEGTSNTDYMEKSIEGLFSANDLISLVVLIFVYAIFIIIIKVVIESRKQVGNVKARESAMETYSNVIFYGISGTVLFIIVLGYLYAL